MDFFSGETRSIFVGGSDVGKTFFFRKMVLGGFFSKDLLFNQYCIIVCSDKQQSLDQDIWYDFETRGFQVRRFLLNGSKSYPQYENLVQSIKDKRPGYSQIKKTLLVIDDCMVVRSRFDQDFIQRKFSVDSHHGFMSICLIQHSIRTGMPAIYASATNIFLFSNTAKFKKDICNEFNIDVEKYELCLRRPENLICCNPNSDIKIYKNCNYIMKYLGSKTDSCGCPIPSHWVLDFENMDYIPI